MPGRYRDPVTGTPPRLAAATDPADLARLEVAAQTASVHLNDVVRADLVAPRPESATWLVESGLAHVQRDPLRTGAWTLGVDAPRSAREALFAAVSEHVTAHGGGVITWWCAGVADDDLASATAAGYDLDRRQYELRAPLPLAPAMQAAAHASQTVSIRTLQPGDLPEVLEVNNAAFAGHAEQGNWSLANLQARMAQDWFDPSLFLVAEANRETHRTAAPAIAGFNWLKPHTAEHGDVARGEIYVIAVHPEHHGHGLGRLLAVRGLDVLSTRGFTWASLFVAADNDAASALYRSLGFTTHRTDAAFVAHVTASTPTANTPTANTPTANTPTRRPVGGQPR